MKRFFFPFFIFFGGVFSLLSKQIDAARTTVPWGDGAVCPLPLCEVGKSSADRSFGLENKEAGGRRGEYKQNHLNTSTTKISFTRAPFNPLHASRKGSITCAKIMHVHDADEHPKHCPRKHL